MDRPRPTEADLANARAALEITRAVADTIKALGEIPSGHLYAQLMGHMSLETYTKIIVILKNSRLVEETNAHLLIWKGSK